MPKSKSTIKTPSRKKSIQNATSAPELDSFYNRAIAEAKAQEAKHYAAFAQHVTKSLLKPDDLQMLAPIAEEPLSRAEQFARIADWLNAEHKSSKTKRKPSPAIIRKAIREADIASCVTGKLHKKLPETIYFTAGNPLSELCYLCQSCMYDVRYPDLEMVKLTTVLSFNNAIAWILETKYKRKIIPMNA